MSGQPDSVPQFRHLREHSLNDVRFAPRDPVQAIRKVMISAFCRWHPVHFPGDLLGVIPNDVAEMVTATTRRIFARLDQADIRGRLDTVTDNAGTRLPQVKRMPMDANEDLTAFPDRHWNSTASRYSPQGRAAATGHRGALRDAR
ncbi:transposase [Streptomyces sp. NPDC005811]|uniref:transposase n=1 Tax=Streptomyces sp. NPDC005811 TaxID=3154565 RepID=UPI0033F27876